MPPPHQIAVLELAVLLDRIASGVAGRNTGGAQQQHGCGGVVLAVAAAGAKEKVGQRRGLGLRRLQIQRVGKSPGEKSPHLLDGVAIRDCRQSQAQGQIIEQRSLSFGHRQIGRLRFGIDEVVGKVVGAKIHHLGTAQDFERTKSISVHAVHRKIVHQAGTGRHREQAFAVGQISGDGYRGHMVALLGDVPGAALGAGWQLLERRAPRHPHVAREGLVGRLVQQAWFAAAGTGLHPQHDTIRQLELADVADGGIGTIRIAARRDSIFQVGHGQWLDEPARLQRRRLQQQSHGKTRRRHRDPAHGAITARPIAPQSPNDHRGGRRQQQSRIGAAAGGGNETHHQVAETNVHTARIRRLALRRGRAHRPEKCRVVDAIPGAVSLRCRQRKQRHRQPQQDAVDATGTPSVELVNGQQYESHSARVGKALKVFAGELPAPRHPARQLDEEGQGQGDQQQPVVQSPQEQRRSQDARGDLHGASSASDTARRVGDSTLKRSG